MLSQTKTICTLIRTSNSHSNRNTNHSISPLLNQSNNHNRINSNTNHLFNWSPSPSHINHLMVTMSFISICRLSSTPFQCPFDSFGQKSMKWESK